MSEREQEARRLFEIYRWSGHLFWDELGIAEQEGWLKIADEFLAGYEEKVPYA